MWPWGSSSLSSSILAKTYLALLREGKQWDDKNVLLDEVTQQFGLFHLQQHNSTEAKRVHGRKSISFDSFQASREGYNAACSSSRPAVNMTENTLKFQIFGRLFRFLLTLAQRIFILAICLALVRDFHTLFSFQRNVKVKFCCHDSQSSSRRRKKRSLLYR